AKVAGRMAAAIVLFAIVSWPLIFLKGKQAVLDAGTVFDCAIQSDTAVQLAESAPVRINLRSQSPLTVDVLYNDVDADRGDNALPIMLRTCGTEFSSARIVTVNGASIDAETVELGERSADGDCATTPGTIDLKS